MLTAEEIKFLESSFKEMRLDEPPIKDAKNSITISYLLNDPVQEEINMKIFFEKFSRWKLLKKQSDPTGRILIQIVIT